MEYIRALVLEEVEIPSVVHAQTLAMQSYVGGILCASENRVDSFSL